MAVATLWPAMPCRSAEGDAVAPASLLAQTEGEIWGSAPPQRPGGVGVTPGRTCLMIS